MLSHARRLADVARNALAFLADLRRRRPSAIAMWNHEREVGALARRLATRRGAGRVERLVAWLAGVLHDGGKIAHWRDGFDRIMGNEDRSRLTTDQIELIHAHTEGHQAESRRRGFLRALRGAIGSHHVTDMDELERMSDLQMDVKLADVMSTKGRRYEFDRARRAFGHPPSSPAELTRANDDGAPWIYGLPPRALARLRDAVDDRGFEWIEPGS